MLGVKISSILFIFLGEMTDLLIFYFDKFGDKIVCGNDLKLYLPNLDSTEITRFFDETSKLIKFENNEKRPNTVMISCLKI